MFLNGVNSTRRQLYKRNARVILIYAIFVVLFGIFFLKLYRRVNDDVYAGIIEEDLITAHQNQITYTRSTIEEAIRLMTSVATLQAKESEHNTMPQEYLDIFDSLNNLYDVAYYPKASLQEILTYPECPEEDVRTITHVLDGETYVSDIRISTRLNGVCDFTIAVPVVVDGEVTGSIFGQVKAELLTQMVQEQENDSTDNYLLVDDGTMIYAEQKQLNGEFNIFEEMKGKGIPEEKIEEVRIASDSEERHVVELPDTARGEAFLMITPIGYNGWRLMSISYLRQMDMYLSTTMRNTTRFVLVLFAAIALITVITIISLGMIRKNVLNSQASYELLARFSDTILFYFDCKTKILSYTPNVVKNYCIQNYDKIPILDKDYRLQALHPHDWELLQEAIVRLSDSTTEKDEKISLRFKNRAEEYVWVSYYLCQLRDKKGNVYAVVGKINDIHDYMLHEMEMAETYSRDSLTGAYNRGSTEQIITGLLDAVHPGMFLLLDIDNFKYVNDNFGHEAGDNILKMVVKAAKEVFSGGEIVGRIGGDEFVVYMPECQDREATVSKIQELFSRLPQIKEYKATLSVGIAYYPKNGRNFAELYRRADKAMYRVKKKGKNGYYFAGDARRS